MPAPLFFGPFAFSLFAGNPFPPVLHEPTKRIWYQVPQ